MTSLTKGSILPINPHFQPQITPNTQISAYLLNPSQEIGVNSKKLTLDFFYI